VTGKWQEQCPVGQERPPQERLDAARCGLQAVHHHLWSSLQADGGAGPAS